MSDDALSEMCGRVFEVLVEGDEPKSPDLVEHLGSCMRCFRVMTELREVPRLASALRAEAPPLPEEDAFWDRLARRTVDAVSGNATAIAPAGAAPVAPPLRPKAAVRSWRFGARTLAVVSAVAAAAVLVIAPGHHVVRGPTGTGAPARAPSAAMSFGDEPWAAADVDDSDRNALRRLLDRLGASAPSALAKSSADVADAPEAFLDDDTRVNDELADLDGPALLRVAQSFERSRL